MLFFSGLHSNLPSSPNGDSINVLVEIDERTYAFNYKRKESSPRKSIYVIINHFETNQPGHTFSPSLPGLGYELQPLYCPGLLALAKNRTFS